MAKRRRSGTQATPSEPASPAPARQSSRWRLVALLAVAVILATLWASTRIWHEVRTRRILATLSPVAPQAPADPPQRKEALEIADRLLREYPKSPYALYVRGSLLSRYGFNDEAVRTWEACLQLHPDLAPIYESLGIDAFRRGQNERAIELLSRAVELDPASPSAGLYLGQAFNSLGRMDEAVTVLEDYLAHAPQSAEACFQLGQAFAYLKRYEEAKSAHQAALRMDPQYAQACFGLATACEHLGQTDQADHYREQYKAMIAQTRLAENQRVRQGADEAEQRAALARAYATAGQIYWDHDRADEAQEFWRKAVAIDPRVNLPYVTGGER